MKICDGEKLYTKVVESISTIWEVLLEDETREKIKTDVQQADQKITAVKAEMEKLSLQEKVTKMDEIKQLQH